jgi:hypothetical protein
MKTALLITSGIFLAALASAAVSVPAEAKSMKECAAQWKEMKAANQTNGMKYRDFSKQCMSGGETPAAETPPPKAETPPKTEAKPMPAPKPAPTAAGEPAKPATGGRAAMIARERACGAEWKAKKADGTRPPGMKWPQFWHECDQRKKAEGM